MRDEKDGRGVDTHSIVKEDRQTFVYDLPKECVSLRRYCVLNIRQTHNIAK